jgi:pyruvate,water dikinase
MLTVTFDDPKCLDPKLVGGKGHGLATMTQAGIPVAPGFVVSTVVYRDYLSATGLRRRLENVLASIDRTSIESLDRAAASIEAWFTDTPMPADLRAVVAEGYRSLSEAVRVAEVSVAVRSSATAEDSSGASFAGEYETYVGLSGLEQVELHIRRCWASAFTARALTYAWKNGLSPLNVDMATVVQKLVNARAAGVMLTLSPVTGDRSRIVIEASYGLGLSVVGGEVTPDRFVVAKVEGTVLDRVLGDKRIEYVNGQSRCTVDDDRLGRLCLDEEEVLALARLGKLLERMHGCPQDIEFAIDRELPRGQNIILLQCRAETVWAGGARRATESKSVTSSLAAAVFANASRS